MSSEKLDMGYTIINDRIKMLYHTSFSSLSMVEKEQIYEECIHDIDDCLYWIKYEREKEQV